MGKIKKKSLGTVPLPKIPLNQAIEEANFVVQKTNTRDKSRPRQNEDEFVNVGLSKKILQQARKQQEELMENVGSFSNNREVPNFGEAETETEPININDYTELDQHLQSIDPKDEQEFEMFMNTNPAPRRTLCNIILEKINERQTEIESKFLDSESSNIPDLDEKMVKFYKDVGNVLSTYRNGKVPKAFKLIPRHPKWEQILHLTNPERWSSASMYQAVRIFVSNLSEKNAQQFFTFVLLPRIRDEIQENKRLNYHLYQSLRKALFKPGAFMKGIILPLCEARDCTLREATIIGSILQKNSVPFIHSSVTLLKIVEMEYSGAISIFVQVFLNKKYSLPFKVIDAMVYHFVSFKNDSRDLPVLWHQSLLVFAQRYKENITCDQRDLLLALLHSQRHPKVTSEIRRELQHVQLQVYEKLPNDSTITPMEN